MIGKVFRATTRFSKGIIWRLVPALTLRFYQTWRLKHDSIVLLMHEGLGDMAAMAAAIKEAATEHKQVYIVSRKKYFAAISTVFDFKDNIRNIPSREGKFKRYRIINTKAKD